MKETVISRYLSVQEIADKTGVSTRTLWRRIASGEFPQPDLKSGRIRRWKEETVNRWLNS